MSIVRREMRQGSLVSAHCQGPRPIHALRWGRCSRAAQLLAQSIATATRPACRTATTRLEGPTDSQPAGQRDQWRPGYARFMGGLLSWLCGERVERKIQSEHVHAGIAKNGKVS